MCLNLGIRIRKITSAVVSSLDSLRYLLQHLLSANLCLRDNLSTVQRSQILLTVTAQMFC